MFLNKSTIAYGSAKINNIEFLHRCTYCTDFFYDGHYNITRIVSILEPVTLTHVSQFLTMNWVSGTWEK